MNRAGRWTWADWALAGACVALWLAGLAALWMVTP